MCIVLAACAVVIGLVWLGNSEWGTWHWAETANKVKAYEDYLSRFPNGPHASVARERFESIQREAEVLRRQTEALWELFPEWAHWWDATRKHTPEAYQRFLNKFPHGMYAAAATRCIHERQSKTRPSLSSDLDVMMTFNPDSERIRSFPRELEANPPIRGKVRIMGEQPRSGHEWSNEGLRYYKPDVIEETIFFVAHVSTRKIGQYAMSDYDAYREEAEVWMVRWPANKIVAVKTLSADPKESRAYQPFQGDEYGDVTPVVYKWIASLPHILLCYICGDVKSPGQYELREGTIFDVLKMAGGTASGDTAPRMRVYRTTINGSDMWECEPSERDTRRGRYIATVEDADIIVVGNPEKGK